MTILTDLWILLRCGAGGGLGHEASHEFLANLKSYNPTHKGTYFQVPTEYVNMDGYINKPRSNSNHGFTAEPGITLWKPIFKSVLSVPHYVFL